MIEVNIGKLIKKVQQVKEFNKFHVLGISIDVEEVLFIPEEDKENFINLLQDVYGEANNLAIKLAFKEEVPQDNNKEV